MINIKKLKSFKTKLSVLFLILLLPYANLLLDNKKKNKLEDRDVVLDYIPLDSKSLLSKGLSFIEESYFSKFLRKKRHIEPIQQNRCEIKLVADYAFYQLIGHENYAYAARYLINMIERINAIFTEIDWGIDINGYRLVNLGFAIKEIKIFDRPTSWLLNHFNSLVSAQGDDTFSCLDVLKSFSEEEGTNSTCLTILISAKIFDFGILGMANIGHARERGICATEPFNGTYMNTAVISVRRKSELMITRVVDLVVAHELGHTWGSFHDDPDDPECVPPNSKSGRYVMHESSNTGYDENNYKFSPCSIKSVYKVLYELAHKCFVKEKTALCGNGILEEGEECDAGGQFVSSFFDDASNKNNNSSYSFSLVDPCCTRKCKLKKGAVCSPKHSECCNNQCNFANNTVLCQPKSQDICKQETFCTGNSSRCPHSKPMKDGIECVDEGKCQKGVCVSFCQLQSIDLTPCLCENVSKSCQRCCRSSKTGKCQPIKPLRYLAEGSICIQGQCHNNVCEKKITDQAKSFWDILKKFHDHSNPRFFADHFVFIIVFLSLLIWCPFGALICYKDHQRQHDITNISSSSDEEIYVIPELVSTQKKFLKRTILY